MKIVQGKLEDGTVVYARKFGWTLDRNDATQFEQEMAETRVRISEPPKRDGFYNGNAVGDIEIVEL